MKKRNLALLTAAALTTAGMSGMVCQAEGTVNTKEEINVGFIQLVDMADATEMYEAFTAQLEEKGYGDKIHIDFVDAAGDTTAMATGLQKFVDEEVDLIVPMLTPPTQAAVSMDSGIPIIFMSVVDPVYSKIMSDWETVNNLATGTSNTIPADLILETAFDITPLEEGKKVCIIYNSAQNNSQCTMEAACTYLDEQGVDYIVKEYTDIATAVQVAQSIDPSEVGIVYSTLDSTIASNFNQVGEALTEAGIPSYAAADAMTKGGAFCSYGVSYTVVGQMTADMVIEWFDGKALEDMPCQQYSDFELIINSDVQEALGIELSEEYSEAATFVETVAAS
ncbi:MAG: ABC transporter substrate-binding protein [Eubacteriales bacterium]|nr:ABC transporter substrate-binding protein [Eubacteriales bacterium]